MVSGEAVAAPIWAIHDWIPCPIPPTTRPGAMLARVAISIAVTAAVRDTAGRMPRPTARRSVEARAAAASGGAVVKKQSSISQSSSTPPALSRRANSVTADPGHSRGKHIPTVIAMVTTLGPDGDSYPNSRGTSGHQKSAPHSRSNSARSTQRHPSTSSSVPAIAGAVPNTRVRYTWR